MALEKLLSRFAFADYPKFSRVHKLKSFDCAGRSCFVKRDDELGFGISGSKVRKYLSLLPFLLSEKIQEAILIGSPFSNHVLSLSQLLKENQISPILFLVGDRPQEPKGNYLLTSLIVEEENTHFFPRSSWDSIDSCAQEWVEKRKKEKVPCLAIPMGASMPEALPGALTLALDILRNEHEMKIQFDHIFIDSGTGMMAASLILAFAYVKKNSHIHVLNTAEKSEAFHQTLQKWQEEWARIFKEPPLPSVPYSVYCPSKAKSFGAVNSEVFETIREIAKKEGFFTDPIYTAKLFQKGREVLEEKKLQGNVLFIHSGGSLSLMGFQDMLVKKKARV